MKYRKKPVIIEATQFHYKDNVWPIGVEARYIDPMGLSHYGEKFTEYPMLGGFDYQAVVKTLEGEMIVSDGDWVITGVSGEFYPCKPDIFEKTYEPVE